MRERFSMAFFVGLLLKSVAIGGFASGAHANSAVYLFVSEVDHHVSADGSTVGASYGSSPISKNAILLDVAAMPAALGNTNYEDTAAVILDPAFPEFLAVEPGGRYRGSSADGSVILYRSTSRVETLLVGGVSTPLPTPPAGFSVHSAVDISADGEIVVGLLIEDGTVSAFHPYRLDLVTETYEVLNPILEIVPGIFIPVVPGVVEAVSADGSKLIGHGTGVGGGQAMVFDGAVAIGLGFLDPASPLSFPSAVNGDGTDVSGLSAGLVPFIWEGGILQPTEDFRIDTISADGTRRGGSDNNRATYWTPETGKVDLGNALRNIYRMDLNDPLLRPDQRLVFSEISSISEDGRVIVGKMNSPGAYSFVALLDLPIEQGIAVPEPSGWPPLAMGAVAVGLLAHRRRHLPL